MELIIIMALALGAMWLMSSKNRKRQQEVVDFRANLEPGDEVMTTSGLFATVVEVDGEVVVLDTGDGALSRWFKPAISKRAEDVIPVLDPVEDDEDEDDEGEYDEGEYDEEYEDDAVADSEAAGLIEVPDDASSLIGLDPDPDPDTTEGPKQA